MKTILLIHGPNLNLLGRRDPSQYGGMTLYEIEQLVIKRGKELGYACLTFQSNHEGALIDWIQDHSPRAYAIIINPGALTHSSYALYDALVDTGLPCVEVHLSDIQHREQWRRYSITAPACRLQISGKHEQGYLEALTFLDSIFRQKV